MDNFRNKQIFSIKKPPRLMETGFSQLKTMHLSRRLHGTFKEITRHFRGDCTALSRSKSHLFELSPTAERSCTYSCKTVHLQLQTFAAIAELPLDMGQILSIPFILLGVYWIILVIYFPETIFLMSLSLLSASRGVRLFTSMPRISSRI